MMFCAEPVGGEQHLRDWGIGFLTSRIQGPAEGLSVEDLDSLESEQSGQLWALGSCPARRNQF